jgi:hypothetical protein
VSHIGLRLFAWVFVAIRKRHEQIICVVVTLVVFACICLHFVVFAGAPRLQGTSGVGMDYICGKF